jgi:hypothetical protein
MVTPILCDNYAENKDIDRCFGQNAQGGNHMNRVERMVPFRTLSIILIVAGLLVGAGFVARAIWIGGPYTGLETETGTEAEAGVALEADDDTSQQVPSASRNWLPEEIGAGVPGIVVEDEGALAAEDDYMSLGRYLEAEHAREETEPLTAQDFLRQQLTATQADDESVGPEWPEDECEPAAPTGPQSC